MQYEKLFAALKSGKVMVAGGFKENLGIGQSFEVEMYDPKAHRFYGFSCLNQKRVSATAVALDSGKVLITGNWYTEDGMEFFDGLERFLPLKPVSQQRYLPYLFKTSDHDVLALSGYDYKGELLAPIIVDRMKGEPFSPPLFDDWRPLRYDHALHSDDSFVGDESKGVFTYLMPVRNHDGQVAITDAVGIVNIILSGEKRAPQVSSCEALFFIPFIRFFSTQRHRVTEFFFGLYHETTQCVCVSFHIISRKFGDFNIICYFCRDKT